MRRSAPGNHNLLLRIHALLEPGHHGHRSDLLLDRAIIVLIVLNVAAVVAESFTGFAERHTVLLRGFEAVSVVIFTIEYALRLVTSPLSHPRDRWWNSLLIFIVSPMALVDLAAILPFYLPFVVRVDLRFLRILRLTRLFRVLKISRYTNALRLIGEVLRRRLSELAVTLFVTFLLLLLASSVMYYLETDTQPDGFPNIIAAFWWAVATLTTVGYGDVYPVTGWGKLVAGVIAMLGIGLVALPTGIISAGFMELIHKQRSTDEHAGDKSAPPRRRAYGIGHRSSRASRSRRSAVARRARSNASEV